MLLAEDTLAKLERLGTTLAPIGVLYIACDAAGGRVWVGVGVLHRDVS